MPKRSARSVVLAWTRDVGNSARLIMAGKAALAAGLAWYFAPFVPFTQDQYSYYAPLGVLISMYPTLAGSVRSGVQSLIGLAFGIGLGLIGLLATYFGAPQLVTLAVVVAVGVLLSGIRALGAGRDWIAVAALFVLLSSGSHANEYSLSYLVNVGFGVLVGVAVNLLIVPPLFLERASERLTDLRGAVTARLHDMADAVESDSIDRDDLRAAMDDLAAAVADVRAEVTEGDRSKKGNPRARRQGTTPDENDQRMRALESSAFFTRDLADVLTRMTQRDDPSLSERVRGSFVTAIRRCGDLVAMPVGSDGVQNRLDDATRALDEYLSALDEVTTGRPSGAADELTAAVCLRRIVETVRPFA